MSMVTPRSARVRVADPSEGTTIVWPEAVRQAMVALARQHRPAAGVLRVLLGTGAAGLAAPYLEARARVVGLLGEADEDPRYHVQLAADAYGLPSPHRPDDADLVVVLCTRGADPSRSLAAVAWALAAGAIAVLGRRVPDEGAVSEGEPLGWLGGRIARARLELRHHERLHVDDHGWFELVVVADPRPAPPLPAALAELDRTACVDRSRVLRAIERVPWSGPDPGLAAGGTAGLRAALHRQLAAGEPDVRALPWPRLDPRAGRDERPGRDVLLIMPHPDDEAVYAGGTLAGLHAAGRRVALVVATDGAGGRGGSALAGRRGRELLAAAAALGLRGLRGLGWSDFGKYRDAARTTPVTAGDALRKWGIDRALEELVAEIRRERPRVLLGLDPEVDPNFSLHGHHLGLGVLLAVAFHAAADPTFAPQRGAAWACDEHRVLAPLTHARWSDAFEIDRESKRRALRAHGSQAYSTARLLEALEDPQRPAVELTRCLQARRPVAWWLMRRGEGEAIDAGIDWVTEAARVQAVARPRAALVEILRRQAGAGPLEPQVERSLLALGRDDAVAVVTGQQVGLLGGPVYTLAKALSAVALARRLQRQGIAAVPVFWLGSQDHDLHEVQRVARLDGPPLGLGLPATGAPVGARRLGAGIEALCEQWAAELPEGHPAIVELVGRTHRPEHDFTTAFVTLMREVTRGTGLLLLDPSDPAFARLAQPLLRRALVEAPAVEQALAAARERLAARGEPEIVPTLADRTLVFALDAHGARRRVLRPAAAAGEVAADVPPAVLDALAHHPERFSPSALLRPLVQDAVLPTIAYVGGPTELRYLEQTRELYAWAGVPRSRTVPRVSLHLARTRDVATLTDLGGLEALRAAPRPLERIGRAALLPRAHALLLAVETLLEHVASPRRGARAPLDVDEVQARLIRLERRMPGALPSLPHTARHWPHALVALREQAVALRGRVPRARARAVVRLRHDLHKLRRSLLRDGRRAQPEALAAWRRVSPHPLPPERRITVAELLAATTPALPRAVLAILEAELSPALAIGIGGRA